jgi:hypothetical protein
LGKKLTKGIVKLGQTQRKKAWGIEHEEKKHESVMGEEARGRREIFVSIFLDFPESI